ncbi:pantoate--beta-alanine ligase [soil metagenome]
MEVTRTCDALRAARARLAQSSGTVGFVPTMGAFHDGHLSLLRAARAHNDAVVVSIFVNPLQFGPHEDLAAYPRDEARDLELAESLGADVVFAPPVEEVFPPESGTIVSPGPVGEPLEGAARPGHFDGVCTVVAKLLNLVVPHVAYFGHKDAQQVAVIERMVADLSFDVRIEVCDTVRDETGLALSSRNAYLGDEERARAGVLFRALEAGRAAVATGGDVEVVEKIMIEVLGSSDGVELDYARAVDPASFGAPWPGAPVLLVVAARVGGTRLIDSLLWTGR